MFVERIYADRENNLEVGKEIKTFTKTSSIFLISANHKKITNVHIDDNFNGIRYKIIIYHV